MLETAAISAPAQAAEMPPGSAPARGVTARSILLGAVLVPLNCFWVIRMERVSFGPYPSTVSLFANVVFVLFVLVAVNTLLQRWLPKLAFSQPELLVLYTMLAVSTGLAGLDGVSSLCQIIPHGAWAATPSNHFDSILGAFPPWLVVSDKAVLSGHYLGHSSFYQPAVLRAWASPILAWTGFVTLLLFVAQCLNVLVHPQWGDSERLTFPIIRLPMAMTENGVGTTFFRDRIMWAGFALAAGMSFWNGLALFVPTWPAIHLVRQGRLAHVEFATPTTDRKPNIRRLFAGRFRFFHAASILRLCPILRFLYKGALNSARKLVRLAARVRA